MKTIRARLITSILLCAIAAAYIVGSLDIANSVRDARAEAETRMQLGAENGAAALNTSIACIEQSVGTLTSIAMENFDINSFKSDPSYADAYSDTIRVALEGCATNTTGAITCYIRFNPEYADPVSGLFLCRDSVNDPFAYVPCTDFSMYDPSDVAHVGWYYLPVQNGAPLWMDPYLNENINVSMISYVVPLFAKDGTSIGIIGMDIDFNTITADVDTATVYSSGYAFLAGADGNVIHHREWADGTNLADIDSGLAPLATGLSDEASAGTVYEVKISGKEYKAAFTTIGNGMRFVVIASNSDIFSSTYQLIGKMLIGLVFAIIFAAVVGFFVSNNISKPIKELTNIVTQTTSLDFTPTEAGVALRKRKDEIGYMSMEVHKMRKVLRKMVGDISSAKNEILDTMDNLDGIMQENSSRSSDTSAATQEIASSMVNATENTARIVENIKNAKINSENIFELTREGEEGSKEILQRAADMENTSRESSERTNEIYEAMKERSNQAIEQSKAVQQINELTEDIRAISSQTNLLALNANIEAARAGEAGRGFAVVADEIGQLANETVGTVDSINSIVTEVNASVASLTECITALMGYLEETVLHDYDGFSQSGIQYRKDADTFIEIMQQVRSAVESLDTNISEITTEVEEINDTMNSSSDSTQHIAEKAMEVVDSTVEGNNKLNESKTSIEMLDHIINEFTL